MVIAPPGGLVIGVMDALGAVRGAHPLGGVVDGKTLFEEDWDLFTLGDSAERIGGEVDGVALVESGVFEQGGEGIDAVCPQGKEIEGRQTSESDDMIDLIGVQPEAF